MALIPFETKNFLDLNKDKLHFNKRGYNILSSTFIVNYLGL